MSRQRFFLHYGDLSDASSLWKLLYDIQPDEIYNLAAQSHVRVSFDMPGVHGRCHGTGALRLLEAIRETGIKAALLPGVFQRDVRQGAGDAAERERRRFIPRSPYACAKVYRAIGSR